jgi:hypothetical protein
MGMARRNPVTAKDMFDIALDALKEKRTADAKAVTKEASEKFPNATVPGTLQRFLPPQYDIDKLAVDLGLPDWDSVSERHCDYIWEAADNRLGGQYEDETDDAYDERRMDAQGEVEDELFHSWYDAVLATGQQLFADVELSVQPVRRGRRTKTKQANSRDYYLRVAASRVGGPRVSWADVAHMLHNREHSYSTYDDFLGNDTPREAVMKCLHYLRGGDGQATARTLYDRHFY